MPFLVHKNCRQVSLFPKYSSTIILFTKIRSTQPFPYLNQFYSSQTFPSVTFISLSVKTLPYTFPNTQSKLISIFISLTFTLCKGTLMTFHSSGTSLSPCKVYYESLFLLIVSTFLEVFYPHLQIYHTGLFIAFLFVFSFIRHSK